MTRHFKIELARDGKIRKAATGSIVPADTFDYVKGGRKDLIFNSVI